MRRNRPIVPPRAWVSSWCVIVTGLAAASSCVESPPVGSLEQELGTEGRWRIPPEIAAIGDQQDDIEYTGAGPWRGADESCSGTFTEGAAIVKEYFYEYFPQVWHVGGYSCRSIRGDSSQTSVHGTGRALDLHVETMDSGTADNELGDPVAHWLIVNAERIGIQLIIWDRSSWNPTRTPGEKERAYNGEHSHNDHLHIELTVEAARLGTPWFEEAWEPPELPLCEPIPAEGAIVDDTDPCVMAYGPPDFWRVVEGAGYGDRLKWTDAYEGDESSNWARWHLAFAERGEYQLDVHVDPEYSRHSQVRYRISAAGQEQTVVIDPTGESEWASLGAFVFAAGGGQTVEVFDNSDSPVAEDQHIVLDALRISRVGSGDVGGGDGDGDDGGDDGGLGGSFVGGCRAVGGAPAGPLSVWLAALWPLFRRRRRR